MSHQSSGMSRNGQLYLLRIDVDGHFHGGPPIKPWVAEIGQPCPRYGLTRTFLRPMNDWASAHAAQSGNVYGVVATFPLRDGRLYEVARCEGNPSKRHVVRRFVAIVDGKQQRLTPIEALTRADGGGPAAILSVDEPETPSATWVSRIHGLGTPTRLGYVLDGQRQYRLPDGVYEVVDDGDRRLVGVRDRQITALTAQEAWSWLS